MSVPITVDGLTYAPEAARPATPAAVAVDLGSGRTQVWASRRGTAGCPTGSGRGSSPVPVQRARITDGAACADLLTRLVRQFREPVPAGSVVVACRPVLAGPEHDAVLREIVQHVFAPSRVLLVDTVRAAAIGSGAAAGALLMADIGVGLTEVALLEHGRVRAARRVGLGTRDLSRGVPLAHAGRTVAQAVDDLRHDPDAQPAVTVGLTRGLLLTGDGAMNPALALQIAGHARIPVRCAAAPWSAAINGAAIAAAAATRHPGAS